jgi:hypothetical protein
MRKREKVASSPSDSASSELQDSSYQRLLAETLLADRDPARILAFRNKVSCKSPMSCAVWLAGSLNYYYFQNSNKKTPLGVKG